MGPEQGGMVRNYLLLLVASVMVLAGCGQPAQPNFEIKLNPTSASVNQGQSASTTLSITPQNGFSGTVALSLQNPPAGVSVSPTSVNVTGQGSQNFTISFTTTNATPTGTHTLTLVASQGSLSKTTSFTLTVIPQPNFEIKLNPTSVSVNRSQSAKATLTITPQNGFSGTVSLSLQPAPGGDGLAGQRDPHGQPAKLHALLQC